jgi:hypothetical protein
MRIYIYEITFNDILNIYGESRAKWKIYFDKVRTM